MKTERCFGCIYRGMLGNCSACLYAITTGNLRGMPVEECYKHENTPYKPKKQPKKKKVIIRHRYILTKGSERMEFDSYLDASKAVGVKPNTVYLCWRRGYKCKGYSIERQEYEK